MGDTTLSKEQQAALDAAWRVIRKTAARMYSEMVHVVSTEPSTEAPLNDAALERLLKEKDARKETYDFAKRAIKGNMVGEPGHMEEVRVSQDGGLNFLIRKPKKKKPGEAAPPDDKLTAADEPLRAADEEDGPGTLVVAAISEGTTLADVKAPDKQTLARGPVNMVGRIMRGLCHTVDGWSVVGGHGTPTYERAGESPQTVISFGNGHDPQWLLAFALGMGTAITQAFQHRAAVERFSRSGAFTRTNTVSPGHDDNVSDAIRTYAGGRVLITPYEQLLEQAVLLKVANAEKLLPPKDEVDKVVAANIDFAVSKGASTLARDLAGILAEGGVPSLPQVLAQALGKLGIEGDGLRAVADAMKEVRAPEGRNGV